MCDSEADHRSVRHIDRSLYKSLAKGATPNDHSSVLILNGSRDNLCSRSRIAIDEHNDLTFLELAAAIGRVLRSWGLPSLSINNQVTFLQKLVGNIDGSFQIATTILLQIENEVLHTSFPQHIETLDKLTISRSAEISDTYIADSRTNHIAGIYRLNWNLVAHHREHQTILNTMTHDTKVHFRALRTTQALHNFLFRHLHTCNCRIIDRDDTIASDDTYLLRRAVGHRLDNEQRVFYHIELHPNTLEIAIQRLIQFLDLFRSGVAGVRIELIQHATNGILHQFVLIDTVDVEIRDGNLCILELAQRRIVVIGNSELCPSTDGEQRQQRCQNNLILIHKCLLQGGLPRLPDYQ